MRGIECMGRWNECATSHREPCSLNSVPECCGECFGFAMQEHYCAHWASRGTQKRIDIRAGAYGLLVFWGDADVFVPEFGVIAHHGVHQGDAAGIVGEDDLDAFAGEPIFSAHK